MIEDRLETGDIFRFTEPFFIEEDSYRGGSRIVAADDSMKNQLKGLYVVIKAFERDDDHDGHTTRQKLPNSWDVTARMLNDDKTYNKSGELVHFSQTSRGIVPNSSDVPPTAVEYVRQMEKVEKTVMVYPWE